MARLLKPHAPTDATPLQDYLINWNAGPLGVVLQPELGADMPPVVVQLLPQPSVLKMAGVRIGDLLISINGKKTTRLGYHKVVRLLFKECLPMVLHFRSPEIQREDSSMDLIHPRSRSRTSSAIQFKPSLGIQEYNELKSQIDQNSTTEVQKPKPKSLKDKRKRRTKSEAEEKRLRKQYSVVWERCSLGISFRAYNAKVNVPCVDFISPHRGQGRGMERVCVNDVLVAINGEKTKVLGVEKVLRWLHIIEKPVVLRFHASSNRMTCPENTLLPQIPPKDVHRVPRPRRKTLPQQPEYELSPPRPPRRNNSMDLSFRPDLNHTNEEKNDHDVHDERKIVDEKEVGMDTIETEETITQSSKVLPTACIQSREDDVVVGDFRQEGLDTKAKWRRKDYRLYAENQSSCLSVLKPRTRSTSRDTCRRQESYQQAVRNPMLSAPKQENPTSKLDSLTCAKAAHVVAQARGKALEDCEFAGMPLLEIKDGTVQAKLMLIYAKACVAKQSFVEQSAKESQVPVNAATHFTSNRAQYLSYTILQNDPVDSKEFVSLTTDDGVSSEKQNELVEYNCPSILEGKSELMLEPTEGNGDESRQCLETVPKEDERRETLAVSSVTSVPDFIPLHSFFIQENGKLTERVVVSNPSSANPLMNCESSEKEAKDQANDTNGGFMMNEDERNECDAKETTGMYCNPSCANESEMVTNSASLADSIDELEDEHEDAEVFNADVASATNSHERELAASVASLDDLLDLPFKDPCFKSTAQRDFQDKETDQKGLETTNERSIHGRENEHTSLNDSVKLDQVYEEEMDQKEIAWDNALVKESFQEIRDVHDILKNHLTCHVLVKKKMIDEIQEILQSLQMELHFERHSTIAIGSAAISLPRVDTNRSLVGDCCYRCGFSGELAELEIARGVRELYCEECWELFFYSDEQESSLVLETNQNTMIETKPLSTDEDALDEALKYSFHDSMVTREDILNPWRNLQNRDAMSPSSSRDSNASSITGCASEVWL
ncbi:hypothetical protein CCR75_001163 [Bremia lactucae]|uniref:PDZ domain-containing protein n=1 Tax=Bremia lactucae TaxID=4779 RepID=A0A976FPU5_BRELC|nr:hypothetical protein CCR75_001163 [Bremia lactucae]